jgi:hypothetical protein
MGAPNREIGCHTRPRRRSAPETAEGYPAVVAHDSGAASSAARVLAGLTQAQLARQVGPTVDGAGVPSGCTFPLVCAEDDDAQRLDQIDRFPVGDLIVDENRWRRAIV